MPLLEASGLKKRFGGLEAVQGFDFTLAEGEIVSLIGPNGSGKTTIFNVITGMFPASAGRIAFDNGRHELTGLKPHAITALGLARTFQNQRLFNQMTVLENVLVGHHCRSKAGMLGIVLGLGSARAEKARVIEEARELLAIFGQRLLPRQENLAFSLSYANRRRLEIARALATRPRLLLLDEVLAGLNPQEINEVLPVVRAIRDGGVTVLIIEHVMQAVMNLCEHVWVRSNGRLLAQGGPREIAAHPGVIEAYLGHGTAERLLKAAAHA